MIQTWLLIWCAVMVSSGNAPVTDPSAINCLDQRFNIYKDSATMLTVFDSLPAGSKISAQAWYSTKYDVVSRDVSTKYDLKVSSK